LLHVDEVRNVFDLLKRKISRSGRRWPPFKLTSSKGLLDPPIATSEVDRPLRRAMLVSTGRDPVQI